MRIVPSVKDLIERDRMMQMSIAKEMNDLPHVNKSQTHSNKYENI